MKNRSDLGRLFFAIAMIGSGLQQLIRQDFVRLVPPLPAWIKWPFLWADVSGVVLILAGLAIALNRIRRPAALVVGVLFVGVFILHLPGVAANPGAGFMWTNPCKALALFGGASLLALSSTPPQADGFEVNYKVAGRARVLSTVCFAGFFVVCGVQHFVYADFVIQMIPGWLPLPRIWTYFTGVALIAGGVGVMLRPVAVVAATLSGLMVFLWVVLLHIPRVLASWPDAGETAGVFEALALSGTAFMLAGSQVGRRGAVNPGAQK